MNQVVPATNEKRKVRLERAKNWYDIREVINVRQFRELEPLMRQMHQENAPQLPFDFEQVVRKAKIYLDDLERKVYNVWVAYREGEPVGFCIGFVAEFEMNYDVGAQTRYIFVTKKLRGSPIAFLLIREFLRWASLRGAVRYIIDTTMEVHLPKFAKMAGKLGFKPAGAYFMKDHYNG